MEALKGLSVMRVMATASIEHPLLVPLYQRLVLSPLHILRDRDLDLRDILQKYPLHILRDQIDPRAILTEVMETWLRRVPNLVLVCLLLEHARKYFALLVSEIHLQLLIHTFIMLPLVIVITVAKCYCVMPVLQNYDISFLFFVYFSLLPQSAVIRVLS